jgi:hypothetical protein
MGSEPSRYPQVGGGGGGVTDHGALTGLADLDHPTPIMKRAVIAGTGDKSTSSLTKTPIDATNLPYLTHILAVGDLVVCTLSAKFVMNTTGQAFGIDFEVDQPISANTFAAPSSDYGVNGGSGTVRQPVTAIGLFVATEVGVHGFRPVWVVSGNTVNMYNATSGADDLAVMFSVVKWPASLVG